MEAHILPFEPESKIRVMFMDEAVFGRISDPSSCWAPMGVRPAVPCQVVREYVYVYGAVEPQSGDDYFLIMPKCNTEMTNIFLDGLSKKLGRDYLLLGADNASWHTSKDLNIPDNIRFFFIPPRTPEMNPTEQIWQEIRKLGFKNILFDSIASVVDQLCVIIQSLSDVVIKSITGRDWIFQMF